MIDVSKVADTLAEGSDGIWYSRAGEAVSYPSDGNHACFQLEDSSFWFGHRNACISTVVTAFPPKDGGAIFDVGGGNGFVSVALMKAGFEVALVEPGPDGAANAKMRGVETVICASVGTAGFRRASLAAVGLFDVVEHIENDVGFLRTIHRLLEPRGRVYVSVPAYSALWSYEDEIAGHFRRYTCGSISNKLIKAGFVVDYATYIFRPLPLPIFLLRSLPYRLGLANPQGGPGRTEDHHSNNGPASRTLRWMLNGEVAKIASRQTMGFGGSCLLVASAT